MTPDVAQIQPIANEASLLLKALAHPARLMICCQLRDEEMAVGDIETTLGIRQPRLSRELAKLREEGILNTRRASKVVFYRLADERVRKLVDAMCSIFLKKSAPHPPKDTLSTPSRPTPPQQQGGFGVFARTGPALGEDFHDDS